MFFLLVTLSVSSVFGYAPLREPGAGIYNDASFIQDMLDRLNRNLDLEGSSLIDLGNRMDEMSPMRDNSFGRQTKDAELMEGLDYDMLLNGGGNPSIRDTEYLQHSSLWGPKYMSGGSDGSLKIKGVQKPAGRKTDAVLPAYCNPPNPCPVGFSVEDGCIENFENTAGFSRAYQASQDCMCDSEHMFDCPAPKESNSEIDLSQNDFLINDLSQVAGEHKSLVAKKFYDMKTHGDQLAQVYERAREAAAHNGNGLKSDENPFLQGEKLPIAAKKGQNSHLMTSFDF
ncbi:unnamed protein product [Allacma fusca]|uniref:Neuroendocrine protein 7B2 n=1 Tax=Allacma fusca TaxID=39272 RepID=A0A8J2LKA4_9HEXA|nr:unnamed protein product [Allacma fusca]